MERNNENKKPKRYYLEFEGQRYVMGPDNTVLYLHANNPSADHFYVQFEDDEDGEQRGHYGWRELHGEQFDEMVLNLIQIGCQQVPKPDPSHFDIEQYMARFGSQPISTDMSKPAPDIEPLNLTPRQENFAAYFGYLLLNGHITSQEFLNGTGELHI